MCVCVCVRERERERETLEAMGGVFVCACEGETGWSWVQPLYFTMASSEIRDIYGVIER